SVPTLALLCGRRLRLEHVPAAGRMMADVLEPFVAGLRDPTRAWQMVPYVLVVALAVYALERSVRRVGADERNVLAGATKVVRSAGRVGTANVDVVLDARERYRMSFPVATFVNLALVAIVAWMRVDGAVGSAAPFHVLVVTLLIYGMLITIAMAMGLANRCVTRDLAARPFLTPLPLAPNVLVGARSRWIAKYALVASLPLLAIPILSEPYLGEMALRGFAALASAWLAGFAAPCVVFLSASAYGVEGSAVRGHMAERLLLTIFALAPVAAPNVPAGLVSLTVLGAFAVVTRQSAERCVRWIDDPEDFVREIPVWRALLSFGAFVSAQAVVMLLVGLVTKNTALVAAISYMVSGLLLMALTWADRRGLPPLVVRPRRLVHLVWGGLGGLLSVGCALGYTRLLVALDIRESGAVLSVDAGVLLLAFAVVIVAPIGEELFFRGWLQDAVDHEYARGRRWFAPLVTAAAFAAIHPPLGMPAVLVLGLIAGLLYQRTRSLLPAVLAHAIHNAAVVFLSVP
ncbi:MAG: CPBP family intramembrane metalloprotease, partial [Myxococcales bacterium]|nr:CPBP family intramembrane metalloprotease [Myxococcales bacterium]